MMMNEGLQHFTKLYRFYDGVGIGLDISRMSFPEGFLESQKSCAAAALRDAFELESERYSNVYENRMVGHYWLRNSSLAPSAQIQEEIEGTRPS